MPEFWNSGVDQLFVVFRQHAIGYNAGALAEVLTSHGVVWCVSHVSAENLATWRNTKLHACRAKPMFSFIAGGTGST